MKIWNVTIKNKATFTKITKNISNVIEITNETVILSCHIQVKHNTTNSWKENLIISEPLRNNKTIEILGIPRAINRVYSHSRMKHTEFKLLLESPHHKHAEKNAYTLDNNGLFTLQ